MKQYTSYLFDMGSTLLEFHNPKWNESEILKNGHNRMIAYISNIYGKFIADKIDKEVILPWYDYVENERKIKRLEYRICDQWPAAVVGVVEDAPVPALAEVVADDVVAGLDDRAVAGVENLDLQPLGGLTLGEGEHGLGALGALDGGHMHVDHGGEPIGCARRPPNPRAGLRRWHVGPWHGRRRIRRRLGRSRAPVPRAAGRRRFTLVTWKPESAYRIRTQGN